MKVSEIWIYPIKACRGIAVTTGSCEARGLRHDRRWMLVDRESGRFVSQREDSRLARVDVSLVDNGYEVRSEVGTLSVPESVEGDVIDATIWKDTIDAIEFAPGSALFSELLSRDVQLVYQSGARATSRGGSVSFADGYPFLLISQASLDDLNTRLDTPLPMSRFRPNFVVEGCDAYAEDAWEALSLGAAEFRNVKGCERCTVTTIDADGNKGVEPLRTLATYRKRDGQVWFGVNLLPGFDTATVRVGDAVHAPRAKRSG